jgi:cytochrome c553
MVALLLTALAILRGVAPVARDDVVDGLPAAIDFANDVAPIFAERCLKCHAGEKAKNGFRLDARRKAFAGGNSGLVAIAPGAPEKSQLLERVRGTAEGERMPPRGEPLTADQIAHLEAWIREGAKWPDALSGDELVHEHWSFVAPKRPTLPRVARAWWPANAVDEFTLAAMEQHGLAPAPKADRATLLRRVSLDLVGLPPTPDELAAFLADDSPDAWAKVVRRLLDSPRFGERQARSWLDLARYADSAGYGSDPLRPFLWPWRDWVIGAFNRDLPYDQFTLAQIAGDLLPADDEATRAELQLATAFHRNTMTNTEGGTDDEEFRVAAVKDRVDTTMGAWMGLTFGCAKCHSHKFDPISQRDYYSLFAFFDQTEDADRADEEPRVATPTAEQVRRRAELAARRGEQDAREAALRAAPRRDAPALPRARFVRFELPGKQKILSLAEVEVFAGGVDVARAGRATQSSVDFGGPPERAIDGNHDGRFDSGTTTHTRIEDDPWWEVDLGEERAIERLVAWNRVDGGLQQRLAGVVVSFATLATSGADGTRVVTWTATWKEAPAPSREIDFTAGPELLALKEARAAVEAEAAALESSIARVPVLRELPAEKRRTSHVLTKANHLAPGDVVEAATPRHFPPLPDGVTHDRLALARWLVARDNPLTARVAVNRYWSQLFGRGLVETEEDFGTQGTPPSHPELLDWLAVAFMDDDGWSVKQLLFRLVTSATYQQQARTGDAARELDPTDRWLSWFPRRRLEAEQLRDQALALAGLLDARIGGPSVYPPQPDGLWQAAFNGERNYPTSEGPDRWRRGLYTFWRRTVPPPSMQTFDAPSRESCSLRRAGTNTPLQAFVTLNDPVFVEAAQALARRIVREGGEKFDARLDWAWRLALARAPREEERAAVRELFDAEKRRLLEDPAAARSLCESPLGPLPAGLDAAETGAWVVVANVLLNLDAVLVRG